MLLGVELHPQEEMIVEALYNALLEEGFLMGYLSSWKCLTP